MAGAPSLTYLVFPSRFLPLLAGPRALADHAPKRSASGAALLSLTVSGVLENLEVKGCRVSRKAVSSSGN